jgi:hypothetical protein
MTGPSGVRRRRGEPLVALALVLSIWTVARVLSWESPFRAVTADRPDIHPTEFAPATMGRLPPSLTARSERAEEGQPSPQYLTPPRHKGREGAGVAGPGYFRAAEYQDAAPEFPETPPPFPSNNPWFTPSRSADSVMALPRAPIARWHLAAWAAWREGSGLPQVASGPHPALYGGTQIGALAQLDLGTGHHRPTLHLRATYAPDRPRQGEIAIGAGFRPMAGVPLRLLTEVRGTRSEGRSEVRPAVLAVSEIPSVGLPMKFRMEGYAQGGWVGGRYATGFADGQVRVTRQVASLGPANLHAGAGAWGGAQKFAARADVGPTVMIDLAPVRVSLDYRMKVAGNASPKDGLAVTLSTGF